MPVRVGAPPTADADRPKTQCKVPDRIPNAECTRKTWMLVFPQPMLDRRVRRSLLRGQAHSRFAFGYFSAKAYGRCTRPPRCARSCSCNNFTRSRCRESSPFNLSGSMVTRSLNPLPSRTVIWLRSKSTSLIRSRKHSSNRIPVPYSNWPIN